jgi:hypothetical protein
VWGNFAREYYKMYPIPVGTFPKPQKILVEKKFLGPKQDAAAKVIDPLLPAANTAPGALDNDDPAYGYSPLHPGAGGIPMNAGGNMKPSTEQGNAVAVPLPLDNSNRNESGVH